MSFFQDEVSYLGHILSGKGIRPNGENIGKNVQWKIPTTVKGVQSFLGMANYYRRFVPQYAFHARPLIDLTKKGKEFQWTQDCTDAFNHLKSMLLSPSVMAHPRKDGRYILDTDASAVNIGAVLSQVQDGQERVIAYGSKSLSKTERNYCVTDRELLAVRFFTEYYRCYLLGQEKFLVRTDHQALKWLFSMKDPKNRVARWIEALSEYNFEIEHRSGDKHGNADAMSRCPDPWNCQCKLFDKLRCGPCKKCLRKTELMEGLMPDVQLFTVASEEDSEVEDVEENLELAEAGAELDVRNFVELQEESEVVLEDNVECCTEVIEEQNKVDLGTSVPQVIEEVGTTESLQQHQSCSSVKPQITAESVNSLGRGSLKDSSSEQERPPDIQGTSREKVLISRQDLRGAWPLKTSWKDMKQLQLDDPYISVIYKWFERGERPQGPEVNAASPAARFYLLNWDSLFFKDDVLHRKFHRQDGTTYSQVLVPQSCKNEIMHLMHDSILSGHLGHKKTREKITQRFYWYGIRDDVYNYVQGCDSCSSIKGPVKKPKAPLGEMPTGAPLDRLATDILGPFPESSRGNRYVLVVTDHFTRWVEIFAVPDQTATTCAEKILDDVIARFGCPYDLHSDQGRNYVSQVFADLCKWLEIRKTKSSPYNPRCNGQPERFNKTLVRMIKAYLKGQQEEWDRFLGCLAGAYRATMNESTGYSPNLLMLGREVRMPAQLMFASPRDDETTSYCDYVQKLKDRLEKAHEIAREHLGKNARRQKEQYDAKCLLNSYSAGDLVWYASGAVDLQITPKLRRSYMGPVVVLKKINDLNYLIQIDAKKTQKVVHHNKLLPYRGNQRPRWVVTACKNLPA